MILVISKNKKTALDIAEVFYFMGYPAYGTTPHGALSEISTLYRSVIIADPEAIPDVDDYVRRLKGYASSVPVFAICSSEPSEKYATIFVKTFKNGTFSPTLAASISEHLDLGGWDVIGDYRLSGIDASVRRGGVYYFSTRLGLTKTETMILRYLIRSYPTPRDAQHILTYAYRPSRCPETAGVRTHISIMNKKFRELTGKNLIASFPGQGYIILTPEIAQANDFG
ncbi:MAG: winged helix-turn-helix domain-containing protein [Clostridia bacterium]|nr:winged helix-turn-helix domain-containing protein [Clostridia bacterium]